MIRHTLVLLAGIAAITTSCKRDGGNPEPEPAATEAQAPALDSRSLLELAQDIRSVEKGDPYDAEEGYAEVVSSYRGKRFRWQLYLVRALCGESQCNAMPFKDGGKDVGVVAGWMPRLAMSPKTRTTLLKQCGDQPQCPFTVEATLAEFTASTEKFTSLGLKDVTLVSAH